MKADPSTPSSALPAPRQAAGRVVWLLLLTLVVAGVLAYINTLPNDLVFDDIPWVADNPRIVSLSNLGQMLAETNRPVLEISLAINYALSGENTTSYRVMNMMIHILAGLVLFGLVRRTLLLPKFVDRFKGNAHCLAFVVALLWLLHPLNTQSVSYLIQRGESLMGLCYLFTLYSFLRYAAGNGKHWAIAAVVSCWIGMGSKEVMATAPLVVLLFDAVFIAKSWREPLTKRWVVYLGLFSAWVPLVFILTAIAGTGPEASAGFALEEKMLSRWTYLLSQPQIIVEVYLRKALWPNPLVLDYGWVPAIPEDTPAEYVTGLFMRNVFWQGTLLSALFLASLWGTFRRRPLGFLGLSFFLILAPTSSFMPIADLVFEHRMYLSLISVISILVFGFYSLINWLFRERPFQDKQGRIFLFYLLGGYGLLGYLIRNKNLLFMMYIVSITLFFGLLTFARNFDYRNRVAIWDSVVVARPENPRGWYNLGSALKDAGDTEQAMQCYAKALELRPNNADAHYGIGVLLLEANQLPEAIDYLKAAVELNPDDPAGHAHLGKAYLYATQFPQAESSLQEAIRLGPDYARAHEYLGLLYVVRNAPDAAIDSFRRAIDADPRLFSAYQNLAAALLQSGQADQAVAVIEDVIHRSGELKVPSDVLRDFMDRRDRYRVQALPAPDSP